MFVSKGSGERQDPATSQGTYLMGIGRPGAESSAQKELWAESGPVDFSSLSMENI